MDIQGKPKTIQRTSTGENPKEPNGNLVKSNEDLRESEGALMGDPLEIQRISK